MAKQSGASLLARKGGANKDVKVAKARAPFRGAIGRRLAKAQNMRVEAVMAAAERSGLLKEKSARIGGRVSPALVREAKAQTGIESDTDLIEFALADLALEDRFAEVFRAVGGTVDPDLKLGY